MYRKYIYKSQIACQRILLNILEAWKYVKQMN